MAVIAAFVLNAGLNFILGIAIARMLGPADFGRFALATAGAVVLNTILFEWLRLSATRFYSARVREAEPWIRQGLDRAYWVIALALFATAALCAGLGIAVNPTPEGRLVMTAGTMVAAIGIGLFDYHAALARARFIGSAYLRLVVWKNVLAFVLMAGTAWLFPQPVWVLIAGGLSQFLAVLPMRKILGDGLLGHATALPHGRARETLRLFAAYGLPLIAANAVYQIMPFLNRAAIAGTAGFAEAGYFALAADLGSRAFSTLGAALDLLLFQIAVQAEEHHGREAAETQVARNIAIVVALLLPCAAGYWAVTPALQALIVPEEFRGPFADYTDLLIPGLFCLSIMNFALNPIFQIRRRTSPVVAAALIGLAVNAVGLVLLPRMIGPQGVAVAQTLGLVAAVAVLGLRALTGIERLRLPGRDLALTAAACLAMILAVLPFRGLEPALALPACIAAGMLVYGAVVWFLDIAGLRSAVRQRFPKRLPAAAR
ncbi:lipopolysaccharide biosynthesis protein [Methylorubrum extorquens]